MKVKNAERWENTNEMFFIRCNRKPLKCGYDDIDEALSKFNEIIRLP